MTAVNLVDQEFRAGLLHVAGLARERLTVVAPRVDATTLTALQEHLRPGVEVDIYCSAPTPIVGPEVVVFELPTGAFVKAVFADRRALLMGSANLTPAATGLGLDDDIEPNIESGSLFQDPAEVSQIYGGFLPWIRGRATGRR